jgi:peptide/nickel transport system substrate-binding protein
MPTPTDGGKTYTFKIREGVKFHDGSPLTAADVAASWQEIIHPSEGVSSARESYFIMVDKVEAPDATTVVFRLKFATNAFLPSLADPFAWIYKKEILVKDPHWFEKNIMGSGPFKFAGYEIGQSIKGERNPDYYHKGQPYLDGFIGIFAAKQAVRVDAIRADRAAMEFRGLPPSARDELVRELGDKITVQTSDWNCGNLVTPNHIGSRSTTSGSAVPLHWQSTAGTERRRSPRSPPCIRWRVSCFQDRRWQRPRRSCRRWLGSGRISGNRARKPNACSKRPGPRDSNSS